MRILFSLLIFLHGFFHLPGFLNAFGWGAGQLTQTVGKATGLLWLITAVLLTLAALLFFLRKDGWWIPGATGMLLSQVLIVLHWHDARYGTMLNVLLLVAIVCSFGGWCFHRHYTDAVKTALLQSPATTNLLTEADIAPLPAAVQRYLRRAGVLNKPQVKNFRVRFTGRIRKNAQSEWMPFTSEQYNTLDKPCRFFFMNATMKHLPVAGFHCYIDGKATMDIRLLSLIPVQYQDGHEMDTAETVTFFNDMCCMAPATLIDPRIRWLDTAGNHVQAAFTAGGITINAWLHFNEQGDLINFISDDRYAAGDNGSMQRFPWSTPLSKYTSFDGYRIAAAAETIYRYPEGEFCYGEFRATGVDYNVAVARP